MKIINSNSNNNNSNNNNNNNNNSNNTNNDNNSSNVNESPIILIKSCSDEIIVPKVFETKTM